MRHILAVVFVAGALTVSAQTPAFDVVSVKPSPPPRGGAMRIGIGVRPGRWEPNHVTVVNVIRHAFPEFATEAQPEKERVEVLVVDRIEQASEN